MPHTRFCRTPAVTIALAVPMSINLAGEFAQAGRTGSSEFAAACATVATGIMDAHDRLRVLTSSSSVAASSATA